MPYKILIDKTGTPKLVEVPEKPKSCNDRKIPCCGGTRGCTTHCGLLEHDMVLYKLNTEKALSDESKWIAFKDVVATKNLLWALLDDFRKPLQGKTFDLPENIGVSFEALPIPTRKVVNEYLMIPYHRKAMLQQEIGITDFSEEPQERDKKFFRMVKEKDKKGWLTDVLGIVQNRVAILTPKPESVPSCGEQEDNWINVKDRLPEAEKWVWIYHANGFQTKGYFVLQNEFGLLWKISGSELRSYGCVSHWQPLPKAPL